MGKVSAYKINMGYDDEMTLEGYKWSLRKALAGWTVIILAAGIPLMLISWKRSILLKLTHVLCHPDEAQKVLLKDKYSQEFIETVFQSNRPLKDGCNYCFFHNKRIKYIWKTDLQRFVKLDGLEVDSCQDLLAMSSGLSGSDVDYQQVLFGENSLCIEMTPVYKLVINEQTRALREAIHTESKVTVLRDETEVTLSSKELVPGDVIILPEKHHTMVCDAVLINGDCIVNESMLTGESCPITKVPVCAGEGYTCTANKRNTLFCGTNILHSRSTNSQVKAVVYRTGFNTMKGELVRTILFPKPVHFKLHADVMKSMVIFLILGIPAMIYTGIIFSKLGAYAHDIAIVVIDVATFVVPPLLPAVLTSINASAQRRLKNKDIYCLNSSYINFCGALSVICFDKTGTLTEDCLDIAAIVPCENGTLQPAVNNVKVLPYGPMLVALATCHSLHLVDGEVVGYEMDIKTLQTIDWRLEEPKLGEPVPFEKIPVRIVMPRNLRLSSTSLGIVRQFPFESQLQRASVVVTAASSNIFHIYCKGAPEVIQKMCLPETVPESFKETLESYTRHGLRILAVASKALPNDTTWDQALHLLPRAELEYDLHFRGFIVLQNKLKPESMSTITALEEAHIKTVMVTGDNLLTAVAVARDCNMITETDAVIQVEAEAAQHGTIKAVYSYVKLPGLSEKIPLSCKASADDIAVPLLSDCSYYLAADGRTFNLIRLHDKTLFRKLVHKGKVFARMLPEQKLQLVEALQDIGHQVGMCGDGANDCGALKAAHAGVSLSVAEASVASPFTAQRQNVQCMIDVIREGRATLAATFGAFRYMVCYCFVLLAGALFLFWDGQKPSEGAYVFIDVFISLVPPMIFGTTGPYPALTRRAPPKSISNIVSFFSILSFVIIQTGFHTVAYIFCIQQPWYKPFVFNRDLLHQPPQSYVATAVLSVNCMSYVIAAVIFSPGPPFRKSIISNKMYLVVVAVEFAVVSYIILYPAEVIRKYVNFLEAPQYEFHAFLFVLSLLNFIFSYLWEVFLIQQFLFNFVMPWLHNWRGPCHLYEKLERDLMADPLWPPVGTAVSSEDEPASSPEHDPSSELLNLPASEKQAAKMKFQCEEIHEMSVVGRPALTFSTFRGSSKKRKNDALRHE
ncbi:polyamine-transporting ATPase 13A3-like isoform X2 [Dermacentor andersoni]|uniref:polyamine-transporting ATPase 13A3-like isoform X2 n=1 Tax=Dermacentor andersoni TaxID=34620 RepID=UPI002415EA98|nr:polyamine-transporting ATPase 13A3-like isoform X2 [Dermacentor andersoni]